MMPQITAADRKLAYGKFLNVAEKNAARKSDANGVVVGGKVSLDRQPTLAELCKECESQATIRLTEAGATGDDAKAKASETSVRQGIVKDFAKFYAGTTLVKIGKNLVSGLEWFDSELKTNKKLKIENVVALIDGAAKNNKLKIERRGIEVEMAACLAGGNKGRAKSDPMADLMDF